MNGANITCFMRQTAWLVVDLVAVVLPHSVAGGQFRIQTEWRLQHKTFRLGGAWRFVFGQVRRGWLLDFVCSNVSVLVLLSGSHLLLISVLILDSYVSYDDTMIRSPTHRQNDLKNVYESQQNLGQVLSAGKACLGSKCFVANCGVSAVVYFHWISFSACTRPLLLAIRLWFT